MPKVSVIVPVYNVDKYIYRCVDSILAQTFTDYELILVDDGSSDESSNICDIYLKKDPRIRVIHKKNDGVSSARNTGIEYLMGEYVFFQDADDKMEREALNEMYGYITRYHADFVIGGIKTEILDTTRQIISCQYQSNRNNRVVLFDHLDLVDYLWGMNNMASSCGKLYRLTIISKNNIRFNTDLIVLEDADFVIQYLKKCRIVCSISTLVYCICDYIGRNSWKHRARLDYIDNVRCVNNELKSFFTDRGVSKDSKCWKCFDIQFRAAFESLWAIPATNLQEKVVKYKRIKEVLGWPEIQIILNQDKEQYPFLDYFFLRTKNVIGLYILQRMRNIMIRKYSKRIRSFIL